MKGTGTEQDPFLVATLDELKLAGAVGGFITFIYDINLGGLKTGDVIKKNASINLDGYRLFVSDFYYTNYGMRALFMTNVSINIFGGIILIARWGINGYRITTLSNLCPDLKLFDVIIEMEWDDVITDIDYNDQKFFSKVIYKFVGGERGNLYTGGYSIGVKPSNGTGYVENDKIGDLASFPKLSPTVWQSTPNGPVPKRNGPRYLAGYSSVSGKGVAGRTVQAITLHPGHTKILGTTQTLEGGYYYLPLGSYPYPVLVHCFDGVTDVMEPVTAYQLGDRLLPPESNGTFLECSVAGTTGQTLAAFPLEGEVIQGSATFQVKPLSPPSIEGPMNAAKLDTTTTP